GSGLREGTPVKAVSANNPAQQPGPLRNPDGSARLVTRAGTGSSAARNTPRLCGLSAVPPRPDRSRLTPTLPSAIPIDPAQRQAAAVAVRLDQEDLMQVVNALAEIERRPGEVEAEDAVRRLVRGSDQLLLVGLEVRQPVLQRKRVMLAEAFHIADFEA